MTGREPDFSRVSRKKNQNRANNVLNILIGIVVVLIIVVGATIFLRDSNTNQAKKVDQRETIVNTDSNEVDDEDNQDNVESNEIADEDNEIDLAGDSKSSEVETSDDADEDAGTVTFIPDDDDIIAETIVNTSWKPIGTVQTGEHVSIYDGNSVDWEEKKKALAYATGLPAESMIFWKIKNGGGPQKSIGIVSSRDSVEKYRVYLEWVDGQGWQPVKMDVLTTLDFEY